MFGSNADREKTPAHRVGNKASCFQISREWEEKSPRLVVSSRFHGERTAAQRLCCAEVDVSKALVSFMREAEHVTLMLLLQLRVLLLKILLKFANNGSLLRLPIPVTLRT